MRKSVAAGAALLTCLIVAGCGPEGDQAAPEGYRPVPDRVLFAAIKDLPGYDGGDVSWFDDLNRKGYIGRLGWAVGSEDTTEEATRKVIRILRHGRYDAYISFSMVKPGEDGADSLDIADGAEELRRTFGMQTGRTGWPPAFVSE